MFFFQLTGSYNTVRYYYGITTVLLRYYYGILLRHIRHTTIKVTTTFERSFFLSLTTNPLGGALTFRSCIFLIGAVTGAGARFIECGANIHELLTCVKLRIGSGADNLAPAPV